MQLRLVDVEHEAVVPTVPECKIEFFESGLNRMQLVDDVFETDHIAIGKSKRLWSVFIVVELDSQIYKLGKLIEKLRNFLQLDQHEYLREELQLKSGGLVNRLLRY